MTFLEAAIEILRRADEAMHFSEIAKQAVSQNLLSHVGRDPEAAMRSCLTSAVRGRGGDAPLIVREKPGHYAIAPGAELPNPPEPPAPPAKPAAKKATKKKTAKSTASKKKAKATSTRKTSTRKSSRTKAEPAKAAEPQEAEVPDLQFEAPTGSGLDGVTDVAVVMANAMSRLVEERPELKDELDAMQQDSSQKAADRPAGPVTTTRTVRAGRGRAQEIPVEERGSRRRRRRRRRGKRVEWDVSEEAGRLATAADELLTHTAAVLAEGGSRSLHVRQIAESLAGKGVLGGEISEIERAVTAAILMDINTRGRASRFVARGDARYQLTGARLPDGAAKAEDAVRVALADLERETSAQLLAWLQSLGARALESVVRIYLDAERFTLLAALPPGRGLGRLVVEDPDPEEEEGRTLALVVPKRTTLDPKLWEGELERNECQQLLVFAVADPSEEANLGEARVVSGTELARWMERSGVGISRASIEMTVLDATFIESIGGLDT